MQKKTEYSVVIFTYNNSRIIRSCVKSVLQNSLHNNVPVYIVANGCTDSTEQVIKNLQKEHATLHLVSIPIADKANAWNTYVHNIAPEAGLHFFIDGDVEIQRNALSIIAKRMQDNPLINAIGGVPVVGRDRQGWIDRMIAYGRVSGGLYALSDHFIQLLRTKPIKIPLGFIGEDFLISALAKDMLHAQGIYRPSPLLQIEKQAGFSFRQLSPLRMEDYPAYFRRLVKYKIRNYQLSMLMNHVRLNHTGTLPDTVENMYKKTHCLPRYYWRGIQSLVDGFAVYSIRKRAK